MVGERLILKNERARTLDRRGDCWEGVTIIPTRAVRERANLRTFKRESARTCWRVSSSVDDGGGVVGSKKGRGWIAVVI